MNEQIICLLRPCTYRNPVSHNLCHLTAGKHITRKLFHICIHVLIIKWFRKQPVKLNCDSLIRYELRMVL